MRLCTLIYIAWLLYLSLPKHLTENFINLLRPMDTIAWRSISWSRRNSIGKLWTPPLPSLVPARILRRRDGFVCHFWVNFPQNYLNNFDLLVSIQLSIQLTRSCPYYVIEKIGFTPRIKVECTFYLVTVAMRFISEGQENNFE